MAQKAQKKKETRHFLTSKAAPRKRTKKPEPVPKGFLDMIAPGAVRFNTDHYTRSRTDRWPQA
ncbi:MAG: hypothetical protein IJQ00_04605 [Kiritimatiellae bacterium]|nr:hypothetical protein [Kiritimatiellia bacterium]